MKLILIVGMGSFLGGIFRYGLTQLVQGKFLAAFPYGTLSVNLLGCLIIGVIVALGERTALSTEWKFFLAAGLCGGFTTFSAFSSESFTMLRNGQYGNAAIYILTSVIIGLLFTFIGYLIPKLF